MCGIAGIVNLSGERLNIPSMLLSMTQELKHRGPDDEGYFFYGNDEVAIASGNDTSPAVLKSDFPFCPSKNISDVQSNFFLGLGHRRLSIIDVSASGHQPMCFDDDNLWIVFNGEIYNYLELKKELSFIGYHFLTNSDTEVILAAYKHWGKESLNRLNGMFALVLFDKKKKLLFGARDRFGVKPFYYFLNNKYFAFASEQKALLKLPFVEKKINHEAAFDCLVQGKVEMKEESLFESIYELMPSSTFSLDLNDHKFTKAKYYQLHYENKWEKPDALKSKNYTIEVKRLLTESIKLRLRSDVQTGACLSGGIDSSSIVCIIDDLLRKNGQGQIRQKVFTACYKNERVDESEWAGKIVDATHSQWFRDFPQIESLMKSMEDITYSQDIPILGSSSISQYSLMKSVKNAGVKVTLDGQGADEIFSGYNSHFIAFMMEAFKNNSYAEILRNFKNGDDTFSNKSDLFIKPFKNSIDNFLLSGKDKKLFKRTRKEFAYINEDLWNRYKNNLISPGGNIPSSLNQILYSQLTGPDFKIYLRTADRNSMAHSVESRLPFADDIHLIEYLFSIPSSYKVQNGLSKFLLRESVRGIVPEEVRCRKDKVGFAAPDLQWLQYMKEDFKKYITSDLDEYLDTKNILKDWDVLFEHASRKGSARLWRILLFAIWKKVFKL
jgi:asparagine synthase (glutamine-hydrolysing)